MAVVSFLVIGAALALALWALWTTLRPELARIADLLVNGPMPAVSLPVPVPARSNLRDVRVYSVRPSSPRRAAA